MFKIPTHLTFHVVLMFMLSLTGGVLYDNTAYAESIKMIRHQEPLEEIKALRDDDTSLKTKRENWEKERQTNTPHQQKNLEAFKKNELINRQALPPVFSAPLQSSQRSHTRGSAGIDWTALLKPFVELILPTAAQAAGVYDNINIDGNLNDWSVSELINTPNAVSGIELYGKYVGGSTPAYIFALKSPSTAIGAETTLWMNTDQNSATGYQIWGLHGGVERFVGISSDGVPRLYNSSFLFVSTLDYTFSADKKSLEIAIPASALGLSTPQNINVLGDISNSLYFPAYYPSGTQYTVSAVGNNSPVYGSITLDGNLNDWTNTELINVPSAANNIELYGKYVGGTNPVYVLGLKSPNLAIGPDSTLWLNTDQNRTTGYKIWGLHGGAEYSVNVYTDGSLHLYNAAFGWLRTLDYIFSTDKKTLELVVPAAALGLTAPQNINVLGDINNSLYFPNYYPSGTQYAIVAVPGSNNAPVYGNIALDGSLNDWSVSERINFPLDKPPYFASGIEVYGKFVGGTNPAYVLALKSPGLAIAPNSTLWLNIDQNASTGYQIWGLHGGAEYSVNVYTDGIPHLYNAALGWISGLEYAYSADKQVLEVVIPATALGLTAAQDINVLGDINDTAYFPEYYASGMQYTLQGTEGELPVRSDFSKRVGIVFSEPSKNNFYDEKAYSQLFMALQHQAMMAGIGFDLITEADLTNINKLVNYDALIFPYATNVSNALKSKIRRNLFVAEYKYGVGIITADNWLTNDENGSALPGDAYQIMKQLLGITRENGAGPVSVDLLATGTNHPAMKGYSLNESILSSQTLNAYKNTWTSYFQAISGQTATILANQTISGLGTKPGVIATTTGGRNVHFATVGLMADGPLVWQALQWVVYGSQTPVALKMGRNNNLFISRNDMDQSQEYGNTDYDNMGNVDVPLLTLLSNWKNSYNFVGSYYINIGNNPPEQQTVWLSSPQSPYDSQPLYRNYLALGNEVGTHSYTHPHNTNILTAAQIEFEFNQSMNQIGTYLNPTWQTLAIRGGAVPGAPESVPTAHTILQHLDYLSGGGSITGAGYPSAIGYLTPADSKVYFSPNMSFDFTLMDFGVPTGSPPVPVRLTAAQAEQYWAAEYDRLMNHAAQPIVHWPWHDYGPTSATTAASGQGYSLAMFENTIAKAYNSGAEFATLADVAQRINTFKNAKLSVTQSGNQYTATVAANNVGKFSLELNLPTGQKIQRVNNWYAYSDKKVFLDNDGGTFEIQTSTSQDTVTHITEMPMRAKIVSLTGNGNNLNLSFEGEGTVKLALSNAAGNFSIVSDAGIVTASGNIATVKFNTFGNHSITVSRL